jgi:uncharacterized protein (DUF2147 family)
MNIKKIEQAKRLLESNGYKVEKKPENLVLQKFIEMTFGKEEEILPQKFGDDSIKVGTKVVFHLNNGNAKEWKGTVLNVERLDDKIYYDIRNAVCDDNSIVREFFNIERENIIQIGV